VRLVITLLTVSMALTTSMSVIADTTHATDTQIAAAKQSINKHWSMLDRYCSDCHNVTDWAGSIAFDSMQPDEIGKEADTWERVVRKMRGAMMPPPGKRQPDRAEAREFVAALQTTLDASAKDRVMPGTVPLHRLNRIEYANAIEEILGLTIDPAAVLPRDDKSNGFDNVAEVLKVSPSFLEQYMSAARQLSIQALGNPNARVQSRVYKGSQQASQYMHIEGLPLGTRGGMSFEHDFPADGDYDFSITGLVGAGYVWGVMDPNTLIITVDDVKVFDAHIGGKEDLDAVDLKQAMGVGAINARFSNIRRHIKAGTHRIGVTFLEKTAAEGDDVLNSFVPVAGMAIHVNGDSDGPRIDGVEVRGPYNATGVSDTASRRKVLICKPIEVTDELHCANMIFANVARKAFRRDVTTEDIAGALAFYKEGRAENDGRGDFESGIQKGLMAILASPKFLYRSFAEPKLQPVGAVFTLSDHELATRLAFFLWSAPPGDELIKLANNKQLQKTAVLEQEVRRMLLDPRAHTLVTGFAFEWLNVHGLRLINTDQNLYPQYTPDLLDAFEQELEMFITDVFKNDRSVLELLTSDRTYLNERLALHYGINGIRGGQFREVKLQESYRRGLLGKGAVLTLTSYANRTTPVLRGAYVLEKILGTPPAAPPPNISPFPETKEGGVAISVRERMEQHRTKASCNACHGIIDPVGLAMENFNAVGQWREKDRDAGTAIDATGRLADGTPIQGVDDLRNAIVNQPDQYLETFTENLMTYALGRNVQYYDMPLIRSIVRNAATENYRFSSFVIDIVKSDAFRMNSIAPEKSAPKEVANTAVEPQQMVAR
jgi:mono/diheme cytochrome c family protein